MCVCVAGHLEALDSAVVVGLHLALQFVVFGLEEEEKGQGEEGDGEAAADRRVQGLGFRV